MAEARQIKSGDRRMPTTVQPGRMVTARVRALVRSFNSRGQDEPPSVPQVRTFLEVADECFVAFARAARVQEGLRPTIRALALRNSLRAFVCIRAGSVPASASAIADAWESAAATLNLSWRRPRPLRRLRVMYTPDLAVVVAFETGVTEFVCAIAATSSVGSNIGRLMAHLQLSYDDVGRMLDVSGETVRRWRQGISAIPPEKRARVTTVVAALSRLVTMFKPDALPAVIRRPAEVFEGARALDWILQGRIADVADRYEGELRYQA